MAWNELKNEFKWKHIFLEHHDSREFTVCQWAWPAGMYIAYRIIIALFFLISLVLTGVYAKEDIKWFLYLTNWSFFILTLKTIILASTATHGYLAARKHGHQEEDGSTGNNSMSWLLKTQWVIYNTALGSALVATITYWALLWNPSIDVDAINFVTHGFNSIYIIADMFVTCTPIHLLHIWIPIVYSSVYVVFTLIYFGAGGTDPDGHNYAYSVLDFFGDTTTALLVSFGIAFVIYPIIWVVCFGLVTLRRILNRSYCPCGRDYIKHCYNMDNKWVNSNDGSFQSHPFSIALARANDLYGNV